MFVLVLRVQVAVIVFDCNRVCTRRAARCTSYGLLTRTLYSSVTMWGMVPALFLALADDPRNVQIAPGVRMVCAVVIPPSMFTFADLNGRM